MLKLILLSSILSFNAFASETKTANTAKPETKNVSNAKKYDNSKDTFVDHIHYNDDPRTIPANSPKSTGTKKVPTDQLKAAKPFKGVTTYKYNFDNGLFTIWHFKKGAFVPVHDHDTDQITYMLKGKVRIVQGSDNAEFIFKKGDTFVLPAYIFHHLEALEDSEMVGVNPATIEGKSASKRH